MLTVSSKESPFSRDLTIPHLLRTSSAHIELLCLCMEPTHRTIKTQAGNGAKRAARYCTNRLHNTCSVTEMLGDLQWETLESRRKKIHLTMLFKIVNDLVDIPAEEYLSPASTRTRALHSKKLRQYPAKSDTFKYCNSFFPRTIPAWNFLPATIAEALDLVHFKQGLSSFTSQHLNKGRGQPTSRIRGFSELCLLGDHTQRQVL